VTPVSPAVTHWNSPAVRDLLRAAFEDEEFSIFCYDYFHSVYEKLTTGQNQPDRIQPLVEHVEQYDLQTQLLNCVREANSVAYARFAPRLGFARSDIG